MVQALCRRKRMRNMCSQEFLLCQPASVSKPSLADEGEVQEYRSDHTTRDEEWFQAERSNVADIGDVLVCSHGRIVRAAGVISKWAQSYSFNDLRSNHFPSDEQGENHTEPHARRYRREYPIGYQPHLEGREWKVTRPGFQDERRTRKEWRLR
jgi:hypothetical protein